MAISPQQCFGEQSWSHPSWGGKTCNIVAIQLVLQKCCKRSYTYFFYFLFFTRFTVPLNLTGMNKRKRNHEKHSKHSSGALARDARQQSTMGKKM